MRRYFLLFGGFFYFLLIGCDGSFEADEFAINLKYPEPNSNCEKGTLSSNGISIPFQWEVQGEISSFELILNDEVVSINPRTLDDGTLRFDLQVDYNSSYSWKIVSNEADSKVQEFRTPSGEPNDNSVPLAVTFDERVIVTPQSNTTNIEVRWTGGNRENDGTLRYDAYWSTNEAISPENNDGEEQNLTNPIVTFSIPNFDTNTYYYILVVARDSENAAYSILKYCQLCED